MLSFRPKGGISDSANDRDVSTSLRFARHDRTTFILSTYLPLNKVSGVLIAVGCITLRRGSANAQQCTTEKVGDWYLIFLHVPYSQAAFTVKNSMALL
jgi:hypothetical protein